MSEPSSRRLNAFDQCMLSINQTLQQDGNPGFETLTQLWLDSRLDLSRLQHALDQLTARHPVLTARLTRSWTGTWSWQWTPGARLAVNEETLDSAEEPAVLKTLCEKLSQRRNLRAEAALAFHLLHLPDESDILLMHFNHVLLDHHSATLLLKELEKLLNGGPPQSPAPARDLMAAHRSRFSRAQRFRAFLRIVPEYFRDRWSPRSTWPRMIPAKPLDKAQRPARLKLLSRRMHAGETAALQQYAQQASRLPSLSMTVLGSVFAAFERMVPDSHPSDRFRTGIGVELDQQTLQDFHPQNLSSVLRLELNRNELQDRDQRVDRLNNRFYEALRNQLDLGILESSSLFYRCFPIVKREAGQMIRWAFSFWYACFKVPPELEGDFAGVALRQLRYIGPAWSPPGLTLIVTQFEDELEFVLTYVAQLIGDTQAQTFLDTVLTELRSAMADGRVAFAADEQVQLAADRNNSAQ